MSEAPAPETVVDDLDQPVILFDGVCNLCNGFVRFVVRYDSRGRFAFAPLQSAVGEELLERHGLDTESFDSVVLVDGDRYYEKSDAALRILGRLDGPWPLAWPFLYLPRFVRDAAYDLVADYRYRIFGKKAECPIPDPEVRERFTERALDTT